MYIEEKLKSIEEQTSLREKLMKRIYDDGVSMMHISRQTGIGYESLLNFKYGRHGLCNESTQKIREYFSKCGL